MPSKPDAGNTLTEALEHDLAVAAAKDRPVPVADATLLRILAAEIDRQTTLAGVAKDVAVNAALIREYRQAMKDANLEQRGVNDRNADVDPLADPALTVLPGGTQMGDTA